MEEKKSLSDIVNEREKFKKYIKFREVKSGDIDYLEGKIDFGALAPIVDDLGHAVDLEDEGPLGITFRKYIEERIVDLIIERISEDMNKLKNPDDEFKKTADKYKKELENPIVRTELPKIVEKKIEPQVNSYRSDKKYKQGDSCMYGGKQWEFTEKGGISLGQYPSKGYGWKIVDSYDNGFLA